MEILLEEEGVCFLPVTVWLREARSAISALPGTGDRTALRVVGFVGQIHVGSPLWVAEQ